MKLQYFFINAALISVSLLSSFSCFASQPYLEKNREFYVSKVLNALSETSISDINNIYSYINVVDKNYCRSSLSDIRVECLLSYAKDNCKEISDAKAKKNCELVSDVIVVNKLSENSFIEKSERYRILKNSRDNFRTAITSRLLQKYARIVTQFSLSIDSNCKNHDQTCLAKGLDQFCLDYSNSKSLSWQYCMSASLWFIGISKD